MPEFREVQLDQLVAPEVVARVEFDEEKLYELRDSIRAVGIIQPLAVVQVGPVHRDGYEDSPEGRRQAAEDARVRYEIVDGHRRYTAAKLVPVAVLPVMVYPTKDIALEAVKLHANLCREDLSPAEEAIYISDLIEKYDLTIPQLCAALHKGEDWIESRRALLSGDPKVFEALLARKIGSGHAEQLNRCLDETYRLYLLDVCVNSGLAVNVLRRMVSEYKAGKVPAPAPSNGDALPAAVAPVPPTVIRCIVCDRSDDPYNMECVHVHRWEKEGWLRILRAQGIEGPAR